MRPAMIVLIATMAAIVPATSRLVRHHEHTADIQKPQAYFIQSGPASYYGEKHGGKITASGTSFDWRDFTAAHPWLPFGTIVRVTNLRNRRWVKVRVTDRGPHIKSRVIDISAAAARELGMFRRGVIRVSVRAFHEDQDKTPAMNEDARP
jgi:rare lipoprotein A